FAAGGLDRKISHRTRVDVGRALHVPAERCGNLKFQTSAIEHTPRVSFEDMKAGAQPRQNFVSFQQRNAGAHRQRASTEPVLDAEYNRFEQDAHRAALGIVHAVVQKPQQFGDAKINVPTLACLQKRLIAGDYCRDADFLLAVITVYQHPTGRRHDEMPQPLSWAEYVLTGTRRIARGLRTKSPQRRAVATIVSD